MLALVMGACGSSLPLVQIESTLGRIVVEVDSIRAPITAGNFLTYVDEHRFEGATFYRSVRADNQPGDSVRIAVIQGGLGSSGQELRRDPIPHETTSTTGVRHGNGCLSMARSAPGTASSEFFICVGEQPELDFGGDRNPDGQGFASFGRVVRGMDVVRRIHQASVSGQRLDPPIPILSIRRER